MDFAAASSASRPRATMVTSAPDAAKRVATASPMPLLPPVTMADRPARSMCMLPPMIYCEGHVPLYSGAVRMDNGAASEQTCISTFASSTAPREP